MGIPSPKTMGVVAVIALAAGWGLAACGGSEDPAPTKTAAALPAATADRLAGRSERIADQLDSGDICGAAQAADDLDGAVAEADLPAELRSELEAATEQLVNSVNCPPPPEPKKEEQDKGKQEEGDDHGQDEDSSSGPPVQEGDLPPGQEKKYKDAELIFP